MPIRNCCTWSNKIWMCSNSRANVPNYFKNPSRIKVKYDSYEYDSLINTLLLFKSCFKQNIIFKRIILIQKI